MVGSASTAVVLGLGLGAMMAFDVLVDVAMNMQGSWLSARAATPVMNRLHGLWSLGALVGGAFSALLAGAGVPLSAHLLASAGALGAALLYVGPRLLKQDEHRRPEPRQAEPTAKGRTRVARLGTTALVGIVVAAAFTLALESASVEWAAFRFRDDLGLSEGGSALGYVAVMTGMTVGRFAGDGVLARIGARHLALEACVLTGAGMALATLWAVPWVAFVGFGLAGLGVATLMPGLYDAAAQREGRPGVALGALTAGTRTTMLILPSIIGSVATASGSTGRALALVALPSVGGLLLMNLARRRSELSG